MSSPSDHPQPVSSQSYVVVARRYRPQSFEDLVGQEHVVAALSGAIRANRVAHAYLFTGARGVGKTSAARILAKCLNCEQGTSPEPCNQCDTCQRISFGEDVDVLEIDGASNRGIDEIRQLRANAGVRPSRSRYKIYIIDEVHMLTREAFNALLKTLEEPPEHVKFLFCTTEPEKIPITILSRCQRFDFAGIQTDTIIKRLQQIVEAEQSEIEPEAVRALARRAAGSMRDAQSLLDQLLAFGGEKISVADVNSMLGTADDARIGQVAQAVLDHDPKTALETLDGAVKEGADLGQFIDQLLGYFRDVMVARVGAAGQTGLFTSEAEQARVDACGEELGLETILAILQIFAETKNQLRYSTQGRILAELALVRACKLEHLDDLPRLIAQLKQNGNASLDAGPAPSRRSSRPASPSRSETAAPQSPAAKKNDVEGAEPVEAAGDGAVLPLTPDRLPEIWEQVLERLGDMAAVHASKSSRLAISAPNRLVVSFPRQYNFHKSYCERLDQTEKLETTLGQVVGAPVKLQFELEETEEEPSNRSAPPPRQSQNVAEHPLIQRAGELFQAKLVRCERPKAE